MKSRTSFVSNSSTTSFVCNICGNIEAERDLSLVDADMHQCPRGHTFCISHTLKMQTKRDLEAERTSLISEINIWIAREKEQQRSANNPEYARWVQRYIDQYSNLINDLLNAQSEKELEHLIDTANENQSWTVHSERCPLCQMQAFMSDHVIKHLLSVGETTLQEVYADMRTIYGDYDNMVAELAKAKA